jgi:lambda family phage portal protein
LIRRFLHSLATRAAKATATVPAARNFAGAQVTRLTSDWVTALLSADQALRPHLRKLRERARALASDTAHGARFVQLQQLHVAGPEGIRLQCRSDSTRNNLNASLNDTVEEAWREWGESCTVDGRLSWCDVLDLVVAGRSVDGEVLLRHGPDATHPHGYSIELLDPDQLDETYNVPVGPSGGPVSMGVEMNARLKPVAYHIYRRHPSETHGRIRDRIPADQIIHWFRPLRVNQTRGLPDFTSVLLTMRHTQGYTEAVVISARQAAARSVVYEQAEGIDIGADYGTEPRIVEEIEPGTSQLLPPGVSAKLLDPTQPSAEFQPFRKEMAMEAAAGLGVAYTSLTGNLEAVNYSSIRAGLLDERDWWRKLQRSVIAAVIRPIYREWLKYASIKGIVPLRSLPMLQEVERASKWQGRGWAWVDPSNDIAALEREIAIGINSRTRAAGERGRDLEEVFADLEAEQNMAEEYGVDITGVDAANGKPAEKTADEDEDRTIRLRMAR